MNVKPLLGIGIVGAASVVLGWLGPPEATASWLPKPIAGMESALENAFDARDGLGTLCAGRSLQPLTAWGETLDVPGCWKSQSSVAAIGLSDPSLRLLGVTLTGARNTDPNWSVLSARVAEQRALPAARIDAKDGKVLVYTVVPGEMASDDHAWTWTDGTAVVTATVQVPRWCSRSWKIRAHLDAVDAAMRSLRQLNSADR